MFQVRLDQALQHAKRYKSKVGLLYIDLDRFKEVNDTLGHQIGDLLLIEAAKRLVTVLRADDSVARLGGDEFTVTLDRLEDEQDVHHVADKIVQVFQNGLILPATSSMSRLVLVSVSIPKMGMTAMS